MPTRDIGGLPLDADTYTVKRSLLKQEYWVEDPDGDRVLATERNVAEGKATYPFRDADDEVAFRVSSQNTFDAAGDFVLVEGDGRAGGEQARGDRSDEPLLVLSKHLSFREHRWTVARPDGEELAEVRSRRRVVGALNTVSELLSPLPRKYAVTATNGERIGEITGRVSLRTVLDVRIDRPGATPRPTLVAAAIAIAVLEAG